MINNRQNGRRRGRGGAQVRNGGGGGGGNGPDRGNRIDNRSRGNAAQLLEKYKNLARDVQMQGDRVMTEYYLQFADHYFRVLSESRSRFEDQNQPRRPRDEFDYDDGDDGDGGEGDVMQDDRPYRQERPERAERQDRQDRQERPEQADRQERSERPERQERAERQPRPERREPRAPQPQVAAPPVEYGVEGEEIRTAGEEEGRRSRRRRGRRAGAEDGDEGNAPRIEVDRLPPAFASEAEPAPRANGGDAHANGAEAAPLAEAPAAEEGAKPVRRRTRRAKTEDETGDSSVAA